MQKNIPLRIFIKRNLFPNCNMEIPRDLKGQKSLEKGDYLAILPIRSYMHLFLPGRKILTIARVEKVLNKKGMSMVEVRGINRGILDKRYGLLTVDCTIVKEKPFNDNEKLEFLRKKAQEFVFLINIPESDKLIYLINFILNLKDLTDFISHYFIIDYKKRSRLLELLDIKMRSELLEDYLNQLIGDIQKKGIKHVQKNYQRK